MKIVKAKSVKDYLNRYYKKSRMTDTLLASYEAEYRNFGYVCTSKHDNVLGELIAWPKCKALKADFPRAANR